MQYNWPLNSDNFTLFDRLKIAAFVLNRNNQLTMGPKCQEFEEKLTKFAGAKALLTSSGSSANSLIFEVWKKRNPSINPADVVVIVPSVTWVSSISPAEMAGFSIQFCDINLQDFGFHVPQLIQILNANKDKKIIIWPTALIGFCPDLNSLGLLAKSYNADLMLDACENLFSEVSGKSILSQCRMTSTSFYFSHEICQIESGAVFFKDENDYICAKMLRNHGMARSLEEKHPARISLELENPNIDPQFLFALSGTNFRSSDMYSIFGLQDFKRVVKYKKHRLEIYNYYHSILDHNKYYLPEIQASHIAFCIPIFIKENHKIKGLKAKLNSEGIQTRPLVGANLLIQPPFKKYYPAIAKFGGVPNAEWINDHGCYIGLNYDLTYKDIDRLVEILDRY